MNNHLTPLLNQRLRKLAERDFPRDVGEGRAVVFQVCRICGNVRFDHSQPSDCFRVGIEDLDPRSCPRCTDILRRAPEIFRWVSGLVVHQQDQGQHLPVPDEVPPA